MVHAAGIALLAASSALAVADTHALRTGEIWENRTLTSAPDQLALVVIDKSIRRATIRNLSVDGAYRVIENAPKGVAADDLLIENVHAVNIRRGLARLRGTSSGVIRNSSVKFSAIPQAPPHLPVGLHFEEQAHDWTVSNVTLEGAQMIMGPDRYWNGDGIATEKDTYGFRFIKVRSDNNTDAGFDLKGGDTWLDDVSASGNSRNYRFWTSVRAGTMTSGELVKRGGKGWRAGIWVMGNAARPPVIEIDHLIVRMTTPAPIIAVDGGPAIIRIRRCTFSVPPGTRLLAATPNQQVETEFGLGCTVESLHSSQAQHPPQMNK